VYRVLLELNGEGRRTVIEKSLPCRFCVFQRRPQGWCCIWRYIDLSRPRGTNMDDYQPGAIRERVCAQLGMVRPREDSGGWCKRTSDDHAPPDARLKLLELECLEKGKP